jgi:hypothetical protein
MRKHRRVVGCDVGAASPRSARPRAGRGGLSGQRPARLPARGAAAPDRPLHPCRGQRRRPRRRRGLPGRWGRLAVDGRERGARAGRPRYAAAYREPVQLGDVACPRLEVGRTGLYVQGATGCADAPQLVMLLPPAVADGHRRHSRSSPTSATSARTAPAGRPLARGQRRRLGRGGVGLVDAGPPIVIRQQSTRRPDLPARSRARRAMVVQRMGSWVENRGQAVEGDMDKLAWLARHPDFAAGPLSLVRRVMRAARMRVGANYDEFADLLQAALPERVVTGAIVRSWEEKPPPPPGDVLTVALGLLGRNLAIELEEDLAGPGTATVGLAPVGSRNSASESSRVRVRRPGHSTQAVMSCSKRSWPGAVKLPLNRCRNVSQDGGAGT